MTLNKFYDPQGDAFGVTALLHLKGTTNTVDTTATGGNSTVTSVGTTAVSFGNSIIGYNQGLGQLLGKSFTALVRVADAGANLTATVYFALGVTYQNDYQPVTSSASYKLIQLKGLTFPSDKALLGGKNVTLGSVTAGIYFKRTTGSGNVTFDYLELLPEETVKITGFDAASAETSFALTQLNATGGIAATISGDIIKSTAGGLDVSGSAIELVPDVLNLYTVYSGDNTVNPLLSYTVTNCAFVTPRWGLL